MNVAPVTDAPAPAARRWRWLWLLAVTPALRLLIVRFSVPAPQPWRTSCDACHSPLRPEAGAWRALSPTGRCGHCDHRLGPPAGTVEACTAVAATAAVLSSPDTLVAAAALWWVLCAVPLAFVDLAVHRLPNPLTYAAAGGVFLLLGSAATISGHWPAGASALICATTASLFFLGLAMLPGGRGIGLGDVKLVAGVAGLPGWWGWGAALGTVSLGFIMLGATGVILLATRRATRHSQIPFGPSLIAATTAMLAMLASTAA